MTTPVVDLKSIGYEQYKQSLKTFMKTQSVFRDYDYEGSNISVLIDLLAYNTYLNLFYGNMVLSERFLDTAQMYNSIVSRAKELNYIPRSKKAAIARVKLTVPTTSLRTLTLPRGTEFIGISPTIQMNFVALDSMTVTSPNNTLTFDSLDIYEGTLMREDFIVDSSRPLDRYILSNDSVDTTTILVKISTDEGASWEVWQRAVNLYGVKNTSKIWFLQATDDGKYEVVFGDGVLGQKPLNSSIISIEYLSTSGVLGNDCTLFSVNSDLAATNGGTANGSPLTYTLDESTGGADAESIESVRLRAPRWFQVQERGVTDNDIREIILADYQSLKDVIVYGGEKVLSSPQFGRIFICAVDRNNRSVTNILKDDILTYLKGKNILLIEPIFVEPDFIELEMSIHATIDMSVCPYSLAQMQGRIKDKILKYNTTDLGMFMYNYRMSRVLSSIDSIDKSIVSSDVKLKMRKDITPIYDRKIAMTIDFGNPIEKGIVSTPFVMNNKRYRFVDKEQDYSDLSLWLLEINTDKSILSASPVGSINYDLGIIRIQELQITSSENFIISFSAIPREHDVVANNHRILRLDKDKLTINVKAFK